MLQSFYLYNFPRHFTVAPTNICQQRVKHRLLIVVALPPPSPHNHLVCLSAVRSAVCPCASLSATQKLTAHICDHSKSSFVQFSLEMYVCTHHVRHSWLTQPHNGTMSALVRIFLTSLFKLALIKDFSWRALWSLDPFFNLQI